jgi:hypothetical protein
MSRRAEGRTVANVSQRHIVNDNGGGRRHGVDLGFDIAAVIGAVTSPCPPHSHPQRDTSRRRRAALSQMSLDSRVLTTVAAEPGK